VTHTAELFLCLLIYKPSLNRYTCENHPTISTVLVPKWYGGGACCLPVPCPLHSGSCSCGPGMAVAGSMPTAPTLLSSDWPLLRHWPQLFVCPASGTLTLPLTCCLGLPAVCQGQICRGECVCVSCLSRENWTLPEVVGRGPNWL
jgi:hypothetical protein